MLHARDRQEEIRTRVKRRRRRRIDWLINKLKKKKNKVGSSIKGHTSSK